MFRSSKAFRLLVVLAVGLTLGLILGVAALQLQVRMSATGAELTASAVVRMNQQIETQLAGTQVGTFIAITRTIAALTPTPQSIDG
ncbi:MAG TPA: hypothetical protein VK003_05820 [Oceanobacillus sp.]|nr:hypothetical protein [Oceanobacillus sp.]